ncbi:FAD-dependent oxidoreductase, partial [Symmachiella dynata]
MCTTDIPENRVPWTKPDGYDPLDYELLLRNFEAGDHRVPWHPTPMPNRKTDVNNNFAISTDYIGANYDYPDGDYQRRAEIIQAHLDYQKGLMWTLANNPRVPAEIRQEFQTWGLAKDEFVETEHW